MFWGYTKGVIDGKKNWLSNPLLAVAQHTSLSAEDPSSPQCKVCTSVIIVKQLPWTKDVCFSHSFHNSQLVEGSPWREKCLHKTFFPPQNSVSLAHKEKTGLTFHVNVSLFSFSSRLHATHFYLCHTALYVSPLSKLQKHGLIAPQISCLALLVEISVNLNGHVQYRPTIAGSVCEVQRLHLI